MKRLNQTTSRDVPGYVDILGSATNTATVTVNLQSTYRKGDYYRAELMVTNSAPLWLGVTNIAVLNNSTNADIVATNIGNVFVPQTPEAFAYDADGNLTNDGRWTYTWDGENRLIGMESHSGAPAASKLSLTFAYDWQGRRIEKQVSTWNGSAYVPQSTNRFAYDGWNLMAELDEASAVTAKYVWGLDLSGTEQGAGGVGGLLWMQAGSAAQFYAYDGNGNVAALVEAAGSELTANYEYGPFGEVIRASGSMAENNPFHFSTKYEDAETGLLYYGYRYYDPVTGRWIKRDPIEERGGDNLFATALNQTVNAFDLLGLDVFRIGFYGLGPRGLFGNITVDRIATLVGAQMYTQRGSRDAVADLLPKIDSDGDRKISKSEACKHTIKVFGYSYGGIAAIGFAQHISEAGFFTTGGSPKFPVGYKLEAAIQVKLVLTIDPVQLGNPSGGVPDNVVSFVNYYQRKGGYAVMRNLDGTVQDGRFGTPFSAKLKGSRIEPVYAGSDSQYQVDNNGAGPFVTGNRPDSGQPYLLNATEVNHDVLPLFVEQKAVGLMR